MCERVSSVVPRVLDVWGVLWREILFERYNEFFCLKIFRFASESESDAEGVSNEYFFPLDGELLRE